MSQIVILKKVGTGSEKQEVVVHSRSVYGYGSDKMDPKEFALTLMEWAMREISRPEYRIVTSGEEVSL